MDIDKLYEFRKNVINKSEKYLLKVLINSGYTFDTAIKSIRG